MRPPRSLHTVRVDDWIWEAAMKISDARRENVSEIIRDALARYVNRHRALLADETGQESA